VFTIQKIPNKRSNCHTMTDLIYNELDWRPNTKIGLHPPLTDRAGGRKKKSGAIAGRQRQARPWISEAGSFEMIGEAGQRAHHVNTEVGPLPGAAPRSESPISRARVALVYGKQERDLSVVGNSGAPSPSKVTDVESTRLAVGHSPSAQCGHEDIYAEDVRADLFAHREDTTHRFISGVLENVAGESAETGAASPVGTNLKEVGAPSNSIDSPDSHRGATQTTKRPDMSLRQRIEVAQDSLVANTNKGSARKCWTLSDRHNDVKPVDERWKEDTSASAHGIRARNPVSSNSHASASKLSHTRVVPPPRCSVHRVGYDKEKILSNREARLHKKPLVALGFSSGSCLVTAVPTPGVPGGMKIAALGARTPVLGWGSAIRAHYGPKITTPPPTLKELLALSPTPAQTLPHAHVVEPPDDLPGGGRSKGDKESSNGDQSGGGKKKGKKKDGGKKEQPYDPEANDQWKQRQALRAEEDAKRTAGKKAVREHCATFPKHVVVYDRDAPCVALFDGEECYLPFGARHLITKRSQVLSGGEFDIRCASELTQASILHGYERVHAGHYRFADYSDCESVAEMEALRDQFCVKLEPCGNWVALKPFEFGGFMTDSQDLYICDAFLEAARRIGRAKTTDVQFHGTVANLANRYPNVNIQLLHNAVVHHTYDLVCARVLANNQVVRVGQLVAANVPLPKTKENADLLGLGGFSEYSAVLNGRMMRFEKAKEQYTVYVDSKKVSGVRFDGSIVEGWHFPAGPEVVVPPNSREIVIPVGSLQWKIETMSPNMEFLENMAFIVHGIGGPRPRRECHLPYWPDANIPLVRSESLIQTGYKAVGFAIKGDVKESHVVVYEETPTALLDAVYGRALIEMPGETEWGMNQHLVLMHLRKIDPSLYDAICVGLFKGNDGATICRYMGDTALYEAEMAGLDGDGGICSETCRYFEISPDNTVNIDDAFLCRIGRRAAAAALSERFRIVRDRQRKSNYASHFIFATLIVQFGLMFWQVGEMMSQYRLITRYFVCGTLAAASVITSIVAYEVVRTFADKTHAVYSVDEAGFTHKYMRYPLFGSAIHTMWMAASRQHVKCKQYLRTLGMHWLTEPDAFMGSHVDIAVIAAEVKMKKHEGSKFGKAARFIVNCGWVTLATLVAAGHVKKSFSFAMDLSVVLRKAFPRVPTFDYEQEALCNLPNDLEEPRTASRLVCYSDDEWYQLMFLGQRVFVCADASSADKCVSGAITLGILPALYRACGSDIPLATIIYNFIRPWKVESPQSRHTFFTMRALNAAMPSGDSNTTLLQNIFSTMRSASFAAMLNVVAHQMVLARERKCGTGAAFSPSADCLEALATRLVALSATSIGGVSTVEITTSPAKATLLKRALFTTSTGDLCYALSLGPILRNFGCYAGDLTPEVLGITLAEFKELSIEARWDRFSRSVVAGLVHEPSSPVVDALRYRFRGGRIVKAVGRDELFKQETQNSSTDRSKQVILVSEYIVRYGGMEHEWEDFAEKIRTMEYGEIIQHRMMSLICSVDYGVKLPDPNAPQEGRPVPDIFTPDQRERARVCANPPGIRGLAPPPAFHPAVVPSAAVLLHPTGVDAAGPTAGAALDGALSVDSPPSGSTRLSRRLASRNQRRAQAAAEAPFDGFRVEVESTESSGEECASLFFGDFHVSHPPNTLQVRERQRWMAEDPTHRRLLILSGSNPGDPPIALGFRTCSAESVVSDLTDSDPPPASIPEVAFYLPPTLPFDPFSPGTPHLCGGLDDVSIGSGYSVATSVLQAVLNGPSPATDVVDDCNDSVYSLPSSQASCQTEVSLGSLFALTYPKDQDRTGY